MSMRIKTTITVSREWYMLITRYMEHYGYSSFAELVRDLIRKHVIPEAKRLAGNGARDGDGAR